MSDITGQYAFYQANIIENKATFLPDIPEDGLYKILFFAIYDEEYILLLFTFTAGSLDPIRVLGALAPSVVYLHNEELLLLIVYRN